MAVLLMASAAVFTACSSDDNVTGEQPANPTGKYTMTINASKGDDATTRALSLGRNDDDTKNVLNATWDANEEVLVYQGGSQIGTLYSAASTTNETSLTGTLDSAPDAGQDLTLYFHTATYPATTIDYYGQDGTLAKIASTYDFCAPATITAGSFTVSGSTVSTTGSVSFGANQQSVVKFTLKDKDGDALLNASKVTAKLTVTDMNMEFMIAEINIPETTYETNGDGVVYFAIQNFPAEIELAKPSAKLEFTATVGDDTYTYTKSGWPFEDGKYYEITVKMKKITDLSMVDCAGNDRASRWTANCYMVHTAGKYKLPLVYGNAIKNGAANTVAYNPGGTTSTNYCANFVNHAGTAINAPWITKSTSGEGVNKGMGIAVKSAELLWQDAQGLITAVGISGDYLTLTVGKDAATQEGNALVAAKDASGTIVWSWHIWVTNQTFATLTEVNTGSHTYQLTPVNLGWVGDAVSQGYNTYYQWGRKDAFIPSTGTGNTNHTVYDIDGEEVTNPITYSDDEVGIDGNIMNPTTFYNISYKPCNVTYYNLWDAQQTDAGNNIATATKKTVYDPCPAGFCVPTGNLYSYIKKGGVSFEWDGTKKGRNLSVTPNVFFPASGYRSNGSGSLSDVGIYACYWSASGYSSSYYYARSLRFDSNNWSWSFYFRSYGCPVRAVAEE
jgi:hypothetical protein